MTIHTKTNDVQAYTHTIYRPRGGVGGFRQISDPAGRLAVTAYPMAMAKDLAAASEGWPACYVIAGNGEAIIGESNRAIQCVAEHTLEPARAFGSEVYLLHEQEPHALAWSTRLDLAHRLTELAREAALVILARTVEPKALTWTVEHTATMERLVTDGRRLMFDAGCRIFDGNRASQLSVQAEIDDNQDADEAVETGLQISSLPEGELEFDYCGIRAKGYHDSEGFVVSAGSEARNLETTSLRRNIKTLRADLLKKGIVVPIAGVEDRLRFRVAWTFFSAAVAAKFVAGAHVAGTKWVRRRKPITGAK